jgi:hypothetical protein
VQSAVDLRRLTLTADGRLFSAVWPPFRALRMDLISIPEETSIKRLMLGCAAMIGAAGTALAQEDPTGACAGEAAGYNFALPQTDFQAWLDSPPDRENIERVCFIRIGVGKHQDVWTANFAR